MAVREVVGTYQVTLSDDGRVVIPAELRARRGLVKGVSLTLVETSAGIVMLTREDQLQDHVRGDLDGLDLVTDLLADRQAEESTDDAGVNVFDASALLTYLQGEDGADVVEALSRAVGATAQRTGQRSRRRSDRTSEAGSWPDPCSPASICASNRSPSITRERAAARWEPGQGARSPLDSASPSQIGWVRRSGRRTVGGAPTDRFVRSAEPAAGP